MDFDDRMQLDTSQVQDSRGGGGGFGGRGLAIGGGGGVIGLIVLVASLLLGGGDPGTTAGGPGVGGGSYTGGTGGSVASDLSTRCRTGADADRDQDCQVVGVVNSLQSFWGQTVRGYTPSDTRLFSGQVQTGCGSATSAVGPFYCPADDTVYVDLGFFDELRTTYGASGGEFAEAYVLAHEYGHHVQDLLGTSARAQQSAQQEGPTGASVRLELQADCFAGVWAASAARNGLTLTEADITDGLSAAAAVGDDRIQEAATGRVDPESWTHGSAAQRQAWFRTGYTAGDPARCDTFAARTL